ncbi:uncharacterized protein LOC144124292 [Amblyomma americanum]
MQLIRVVALALSCISFFHILFCAGKPKHELRHETAEVGKVFESFPHLIAMFDIDKDGDLDCVSAVGTDYDSSVPRLTYVWMFPGVNGHEPRNISYVVVPGPSPDTFRFWDKNGDGTVQTGRYVYTDYKECLIIDFYDMKECMLWTSWDVKDAFSQTCMDQYEDNCDVVNMPYDQETCSPFFNV